MSDREQSADVPYDCEIVKSLTAWWATSLPLPTEVIGPVTLEEHRTQNQQGAGAPATASEPRACLVLLKIGRGHEGSFELSNIAAKRNDGPPEPNPGAPRLEVFTSAD
jgi:hypothetical protein